MIKTALKTLLWLSISLLSFIGFAIGCFEYFKPKIIHHLVKSVNKMQNGEIKVNDVSLSFWENFPSISVQLGDISYFESKNTTDSLREPFLTIQELRADLNANDLLDSMVVFHQMHFHGIDWGLVRYANGQTNIGNALGLNNIDTVPNTEIDSLTQIAKGHILFSLEEITMSQLQVSVENQIEDIAFDINIDKLNSSFFLSGDFLEANVQLSSKLNGDADKGWQEEIPIDLDASFTTRMDTFFLNIPSLKLKAKNFMLSGNGYFDLKKDAWVNLNLKAQHDNLSLITLSSSGLSNDTLPPHQKKGSITALLKVRGPILTNKVEGFLDFKIEDLSFKHEKFAGILQDISIEGYAYKKGITDFSNLHLELPKFYFTSKYGYGKGALSFDNKTLPHILLKADLKGDLKGLGSVFDNLNINHLNGDVSLNADLDFEVYPDKRTISTNPGKFNLKIDNGQLKHITSGLLIKNINTNITLNNDKISVKYLKAKSGKSSINLNGNIDNLILMSMGYPTTLKAHLNIASPYLSLTHTLGKVFPENTFLAKEIALEDINTQAIIQTHSNEIFDFEVIPKMDIKLPVFYAKINKLPAIELLGSHIECSDQNISINHTRGSFGNTFFQTKGKLFNTKALSSKKQEEMGIDFEISSDHLYIEDFFSQNDSILIPELYRDQLDFFKLSSSIDFDNLLLTDSAAATNFNLKINSLKGHSKWANTNINLKSLEAKQTNHETTIKRGNIILGKSEFYLEGIAKYLFDENQPSQFNGSINLGFLDFDELIATIAKIPISEDDSLLTLPEINSSINLDRLVINKTHVVTNLTGDVKIKDNILHIPNLKLKAAQGIITSDTKLEFQSNLNTKILSSFVLTNANLSKIPLKMEYNGIEFKVEKYVQGHISGKGNAVFPIQKNGIINLNELVLNADLKVVDGGIYHFPPLLGLSSYFGRKDLSSIEFSELENSISIHKGIATFSKMNVSSTIGWFSLKGKQKIYDQMDYEYDIEMPLTMVAGVAFNKFLSGFNFQIKTKKGELKSYMGITYVPLVVRGDLNRFEIGPGNFFDF